MWIPWCRCYLLLIAVSVSKDGWHGIFSLVLLSYLYEAQTCQSPAYLSELVHHYSPTLTYDHLNSHCFLPLELLPFFMATDPFLEDILPCLLYMRSLYELQYCEIFSLVYM